MSKGGRGGKRAGPSASGELNLPDGSKIEFDGKLKYNGNDPNVTGLARSLVESFEDRRFSLKAEYAFAVDENGRVLGKETRGNKGSISLPYNYHQKGAILTHTHPREQGVLGGTFSRADMRLFALADERTLRAGAKEGTYSITKTSKFDSSGFLSFSAQADKVFQSNYKKLKVSAEKKFNEGKIDYDTYVKEHAKAFNTALVGLHDYYDSGQKKYGYTYTLEKRG